MSALPHVVVLGGGPAGCGAAYQLRRTGKARVTLLERQQTVGGVAGSFEWGGQWLDYGSHRLHHTVRPEVLADIQKLLGSDFGDFDRHGRIRLRGQWLHFPIQVLDLLRRLDKGFALGMMRDMVARKLRKPAEGDTFASVLQANLGTTMCEHFYFPYARKLWGHPPEALSSIQARKRVTAGSFGKLIKRLLKPVGGGKYYYMREGYGQISRAYAAAATSLGAEVALGWGASAIERTPNGPHAWSITAESGTLRRTLEADFVWSTLPITQLIQMMVPEAPAPVLSATQSIKYRAMVLVYVQLPVAQYTTTDAHYFPEANVRVTRLSEPKNYFRSTQPTDTTVLCAEYPCQVGDELWTANDETLATLVAKDTATAGIPLPAKPIAVHVRRIPRAYPIYTKGYEHPLTVLDQWAAAQPNMLVYGRQGLFAHDNTHHALFMAYSAVDCLTPSGFDSKKWSDYREIFATHVVED